MRVHKLDQGWYEVTGLPIRGYDWRFCRANGAVYAIYAGPEAWEGDDAEMNYEPSDPAEQEKINEMGILRLASLAHSEILNTIESGEERRL